MKKQNVVGTGLKRAGQKGFTLLEIMIVVVILGLLASFVIPNLMGNKEKADHQKAVSDITALENALDMYRLDNGRYPTEAQGLQALVKKPETAPLARHYPDEGYLRRLPQDPWGGDYSLRNPGKMNRIDIFSAGADGVPDTDDDVINGAAR